MVFGIQLVIVKLQKSYEFKSAGSIYDYFIVENFRKTNERFSALKLKPNPIPGKYINVPDYSPFSRMSKIDIDGVCHLFGNENYELAVMDNKIVTFNVEST